MARGKSIIDKMAVLVLANTNIPELGKFERLFRLLHEQTKLEQTRRY